MTRPIHARINLDALKHNYQLAKQYAQGPCLAVIKANAYGHGAVPCAQALAAVADGFAVAALSEATELRKAEINQPILLLEGIFEPTELNQAAAMDCWLVVHSQWQVDCLLQTELDHAWHIWLKVETGMHRLGMSVQQAQQALQALMQSGKVAKVTLMTHFANADAPARDETQTQLQHFQQLMHSSGYKGDISLANSAALLSQVALDAEQFASSWGRPGLMLYGANPFYGNATAPAVATQLTPVMQLSAGLIAIQTLKAGDCIGYGGIYQAQQAMRVGVVACGYADGYPRTAINAPAYLNGKMTTVIGRVSMDMLFVDLQNIDDAVVGSMVELWGEHVSVDAVAAAANTLAYELLCNVKRVTFDYQSADSLK